MPSISELRKHVTHFTEEVRLKASPGEEVTVAGQITQSFWLGDSLHVITIDDFVGAIRVYMSAEMANHYKDLIQAGNFVAVSGFVNVITVRRGKFEEKQHSIVAYEMKPL